MFSAPRCRTERLQSEKHCAHTHGARQAQRNWPPGGFCLFSLSSTWCKSYFCNVRWLFSVSTWMLPKAKWFSQLGVGELDDSSFCAGCLGINACSLVSGQVEWMLLMQQIRLVYLLCICVVLGGSWVCPLWRTCNRIQLLCKMLVTFSLTVFNVF